VKEQVQSLGAKFLAVEDEEFKAAETAGGYAKEMSKEYQAKQAALIAEHIAKQDIVITTALIPGRPAPKLVSAAMVASMKPGSVLVDLAVERGGNVEGAVAGAVITLENGVKIVGHLNVPGRVAASASLLYAKNLYAFVETMVDKAAKTFAINREDELVKATMLTDGGKIVHPSFANVALTAGAEKPKPIVPGQNRGDDPATGGASPTATAEPKPIVPGQNRGDDPATDSGASAPKKPASKKSRKPASGGEG
jgi:NAD(P) transhydrogenase subunit alpha